GDKEYPRLRCESIPGCRALRPLGQVRGPVGLDHLADVVVKLNQVDEDRPLHSQKEVLLVLLELGVQSIDDTLAGCLGADLAVEERLQACKTMLDERAKLTDRRDDPGGRVGSRL